MDYDGACAAVYGMPYQQWKKLHQKKATEDQMAQFEATKQLHAQHPKAVAVAPQVSSASHATAPEEAPPLVAGTLAVSSTRSSKYPMVDVDDALASVLQECTPLDAEAISADEAVGRVLRSDVIAADPLPPFAACVFVSRMCPSEARTDALKCMWPYSMQLDSRWLRSTLRRRHGRISRRRKGGGWKRPSVHNTTGPGGLHYNWGEAAKRCRRGSESGRHRSAFAREWR